jgi:hypothetical protein
MGLSLSVVVPFRDADGTRTSAMQWVRARWQHHWPEAEFIVAPDDGVDPFNKPMAVNNAAIQATGDLLAIMDADVWIDPGMLQLVIDKLENGVCAWAKPARWAFRMKQDFSERLMRIPPHHQLPPISARDAETHSPVVGFLWLVPRLGFERMGGMDERWRGWGGEDTSFSLALDKVLGHHRTFSASLICLWHPRPRQGSERIWPGQDRTQEHYKQDLIKEYRRASGAAGMLEVLAQGGGVYRERLAVA